MTTQVASAICYCYATALAMIIAALFYPKCCTSLVSRTGVGRFGRMNSNTLRYHPGHPLALAAAAQAQAQSSSTWSGNYANIDEYLILDPATEHHGDNELHTEFKKAVELLVAQRPNINVVYPSVAENQFSKQGPSFIWTSYRRGIQLDATSLEPHFLGKKKLTIEENASKWDEIISSRLRTFAGPSDVNDDAIGISGELNNLKNELNAAMIAVHRASFMTRSLQSSFCQGGKKTRLQQGLDKEDQSPVTIADFAAQALILDRLSLAFPNDTFIAEEDSALLRTSPEVRKIIRTALEAATGETWTDDRLYSAVDKGSGQSTSVTSGRVWVLDPVDGTKGFIRNEHYCVALALLVDGTPRLSVMGCPNVNMNRVLERSLLVGAIDPAIDVAGVGQIPSLHLGSVFFAVTNHGAFGRALTMPIGAAYEGQASSVSVGSEMLACESAEAMYGSRDLTVKVRAALKIQPDFLRLDGQCKSCLVGFGAADANLRLPPNGYREKIWDHAPGFHFISEAGGQVTDEHGEPIDFTLGRLLAEGVTGVISSNGLVHQDLIREVLEARKTTVVSPKEK